MLLANTPAQTEFLLHSLEQTASGISLYMNSNKTEFICFNKDSVVFSLNSKPLNIVDQFIYLSSNISSTESDVNIHIDTCGIMVFIIGNEPDKQSSNLKLGY